MSLTPSRKLSAGQRRRSVGTSSGSGRYSHGDTSNTNTYPGRGRGAEGSPTSRTYPNTPRRQAKQAACSDNHGIRPPTPEQYLTPLQQKEVCIRHLRARLRENVERLQHRDDEIDELRTQLCRMQEDWIEEECHRVEAQLALKEARREIQHLQEVVESVRSNRSAREPPENPREHKPYGERLRPGRPAVKSRSCGCSPAGTLSRSATYTRLSSEALALQLEGSAGGARPAPPPPQTHLLLEAALLSEQLPPTPGCPPAPSHSYERLCSGGAVLPISHSCHALSGGCRCNGPAYLPHHHLFLHLPQEEPPQPPAAPVAPVAPVATAPATAAVPVPAAPERKAEVRSQACSPTMTWICEEELSFISSATADTELCDSLLLPPSLPPSSPLDRAYGMREEPATPHTCQPQPVAPPSGRQEATVVEVGEESGEELLGADGGERERPSQLCHWSRYFLVDLLALAMPVVPTVAWLCRGAPREVMSTVPIGSLLRGCCAVALHSLRRRAAGRCSGPASMDSATPI